MSKEPNPEQSMYHVSFDIPGDADAHETIQAMIRGILPRIFTQVPPESIVVEQKEKG